MSLFTVPLTIIYLVDNNKLQMILTGTLVAFRKAMKNAISPDLLLKIVLLTSNPVDLLKVLFSLVTLNRYLPKGKDH